MVINKEQLEKHESNIEVVKLASDVNDLKAQRDRILDSLHTLMIEAQNIFNLYVSCDDKKRAVNVFVLLHHITVGGGAFPEVLSYDSIEDRKEEIASMLAAVTGDDYRTILKPLIDISLKIEEKKWS